VIAIIHMLVAYTTYAVLHITEGKIRIKKGQSYF